ncbi:MAG TPA: signal peptidase I, partial [Bacilli bacterium]|nr:signal peptidase I [Bacilli bacterium]
MKPWVKDLISYVIIFLAVVIIRTFVATPVRVTGVSMYPTLSGTEIMILNKLGKIERMKVVVIDRGSDDKIIKRVIGLPNEEVAIINNIIYINDKPLTDKYGQGNTEDMQKIKLAYD